jgi:hypothetical protein
MTEENQGNVYRDGRSQDLTDIKLVYMSNKEHAASPFERKVGQCGLLHQVLYVKAVCTNNSHNGLKL